MSAFTGVRTLFPATARTHAHTLAPWIAGVTALSVSSILAYRLIFPDLTDRKQLSVALGGNPALSLIFGPARDLMTNDGFNAWRSGALGTFFAALMAILTVVATSRADEDSGRAELLASGVMSRQARLGVAVLLTGTASVVLGAVCALLTIAAGGAVVPSVLLAATFTASGLMFTGVAAVTVHLGSDARSASSIAVAVLGICFVLRGLVDSIDAPDWASWATPFGWLGHVGPATDNNPWPLLLSLAVAAVLATCGFVLNGRRDYGAGLISQRLGPSRGGSTATVWGLAFRLHRGSLVTWLVAVAGLGVLFGYLGTSITDLLGGNPALSAMLATGSAKTSGITFAFLVTILQMLGLITAVSGVQIINRIAAEENDFRVEPLLAGALRRPTYLASNLLVAYLAPAVCLFTGAGVIGAITASADTGVAFIDVLAQAAGTVPAVWTLISVAAAAVGARPEVRLVGWLTIVATFGLTMLGPTFKLPEWALDISPLHQVPNVTAANPDWTGLAVVAAGCVVFTAIAFTGFRRRDIA